MCPPFPHSISLSGSARIWRLIPLLCLFPVLADARFSLNGIVGDAETGEALENASIRIEATGVGTLADESGAFRLSVDTFPTTLLISHVGYETREMHLPTAPDAPLSVLLLSVPYLMEETVVQWENPAVRIMREVIRRKPHWHPPLQTWSVEAYTRQVLYRDTRIAGIREELSKIYWDADRGIREIVRGKKHTANVPNPLQYFAASAGLVDLCADEVEVLGQRLVGPTHPEALAHYSFELADQRLADGDSLYEISVMPRGSLSTAFAGYLVILAGSYAVVEAGLRPTPAIAAPHLPVESGIGIRFRQHLAPFPSGMWLPVDLEYEVEARFGTSALREKVRRLRNYPTPHARLVGISRVWGHRVHTRAPEFVYQNDALLEIDGLAADGDDFVRPEQTALSPREEQVYTDLAGAGESLGGSPVAGLYALYPGLAGPAAPPSLAPDPFIAETLVTSEVLAAAVSQGIGVAVPRSPSRRLTAEPEVWYNRVEGAHVAYRTGLHPHHRLGLFLKGGYAFAPERRLGGAAAVWSPGHGSTVSATYDVGPRPAYHSDNYNLARNSFPVLLGIGDYFDYYWSEGWRLGTEQHYPDHKLLVDLGYSLEDHSSLAKGTDVDLLCDFQPESGRFYGLVCKDRDHTFRANPAIEPGRLGSVDLRMELGGPYTPRGRRAHRRSEVRLEHASSHLGSDFDFTRIQLILDWHLPTFMPRRASPNTLHLRLVGGSASGDLPVQRYGALDAAIWRFTPFGAFRTRWDRPYLGRSYAALFWEHDFGGMPFEALGMPRLAAAGVGLIVHGASGKTWGSRGCCPSRSPMSHHELGLSLVLDNAFRLDLTRRLDRRGSRIGFSLARSGL